jgi:hypothetical protein
MTRNIDGPLLGTTTHIYKVAKFRGCRAGLEAKEDVRLITQTASNPLISEFNEEGVQVKSGEELSIKIFTIAGQYNNCPMFAKFTPEVGKDYELRLLGRVNISPHQCKAELWSTEVGTNIIKQEDFKDFDSCLPK